MTVRGSPLVSSAPFAHAPQSTSSLSVAVLAALAPALAWGAWLFGARALLVVGVASLSALASEGAANLLARRSTLADFGALVTGVLIGLSMPPGVPLGVPAAAAAFGVLVAKWTFGGPGANWMNPALAGVAFAHLNWPASMASGWYMPRALSGVDGLSASTPLGYLRAAGGASGGTEPLEALRNAGYPSTGFDALATDFLNRALFRPLGAVLPPGYADLVAGFRPGAIGEVAALLLLLGSIALIARRVIRWEVPLASVLAFSALARVFGAAGEEFLGGDVLFSLFTGSFLLLVFYVATDPVTSPVSRPAALVYGAGVGILAFLLRRYGARAEGGAFAVLAMNCLVPLLDRAMPAAGRRRTP